MLDELEQVIKTLSLNMIGDDYFLLKRGGGYSDFFTLPQRISNIAAWALLSLHINDSLKEKNTELEGAVENILNNLTQNYSASYDLMSEEQAPAIAVISKFVRLIDRVDWADEYIGCLYSAFFFNRRKVAHVNLKDELVYGFMRHRLIDEDANYQKFCARPTEVLFSLMAHYQQSNNLEIIRYDFEELDDVNINAYVPESYSSFAEERIPNGNNIGFTIGFDIFTADDFNNFVNSFLHPPVLEALKSTTDQERLIAIVASLIYPNRLPWFLILPN